MCARLARRPGEEKTFPLSVPEKDYSNLELVPYQAGRARAVVRPIPPRLVRSARHDPGRAQVYAYVTVNGSSLRGKKTATTNSRRRCRRRGLFGMLRVRRNRHRRHARAALEAGETERFARGVFTRGTTPGSDAGTVDFHGIAATRHCLFVYSTRAVPCRGRRV